MSRKLLNYDLQCLSQIGDNIGKKLIANETNFWYCNTLVRQLAWVIGSPPLVNHSALSSFDECWYIKQLERSHEWLAALDSVADPLADFVSQERDHRLGARFERLIEYWLKRSSHQPSSNRQYFRQQSSRYELIHRGLQWIEGNQTLGEFDFIVHDREDDVLEHWEVACKFYLGVVNDGITHWIGPGKKDRFARKLRYLESKQLQLSHTEHARDFLRRQGYEIERVRALIKGRLFYPEQVQDDCSTEDLGLWHVNPSHERGRWMTVERLVEKEPSVVRVLGKSTWLDPKSSITFQCSEPRFIQPRQEQQPVNNVTSDVDIAQEEVIQLARSTPIYAEVMYEDHSQERIFLVPENWFTEIFD